MSNVARQNFTANGTFVAPAGVYRVKVCAYNTQNIFPANQMPGFGWPRAIRNWGICGLIRGDQTLWTWGQGEAGANGNLSGVNNSSTPILVSGGVIKYQQMAATYYQGFFLDTIGNAYGAGNNAQGLVGNASSVNVSSPTPLAGNRQYSWIGAMSDTSSYTIGAIDLLGNLWCWGTNNYGQVGNGTSTANISSPVQVVGGRTWAKWLPGSYTAMAIDNTGQLWSWGQNGSNGMLGNGTNTTNVSSPVAVGGATRFTYASNPFGQYAAALDTAGNIWMWGANGYPGVLGQGNSSSTYAVSSPIMVIGGVKYQYFVLGTNKINMYALDVAGNIWAWGDNSVGQLGTGDIIPRSSPVMVSGGRQYITLNRGGSSTESVYAIDTAGNMWAWGANLAGMLGTGDLVGRSTPTQVVGGNTWAQILSDGSQNGVMAVDTGGRIWSWGDNTSGQIGNGTSGNQYSSPVLIAGSHVIYATNPEVDMSLDVVPGQSYAVTVAGFYAKFGTNVVSQLANKITVEYDQ